jgi:hypothetical protein
VWQYQDDLRPEEIEEIQRQEAQERDEIRDRVARNTARREQNRSQEATDAA